MHGSTMHLIISHKIMRIGYSSTEAQPSASNIEYKGNVPPIKPLSSSKKYAVFHIEGGLGKNVASTSIVKLIKETHSDRDLIVVASYPEVFLNNPYVDRVYRIGNTPYFYDDYILNKDVLVFRHEPYFQTSHILKQKSLIQNWAELYNLEYKKDLLPEIYMNMVQDMIGSMWSRPKPILLLHTNGGFYSQQKYTYSWTRDMPIVVATEIVNKCSDKYHIIQICREQSQVIPGAEAVFHELSNMELFSLLRMSEKRILIDSCLQHAAAAFRLPSLVLWVGTSPSVFGYSMHTNITANVPPSTTKLIDSYLFDYQFDGILHECPYLDMNKMFNVNDILKAIE